MKKLITLILSLSSTLLLAQAPEPPSGNVTLAKQYIDYLMYGPAMDELKIALKKEPENEKVNQLLAECYLNTSEDKTKAIPLLEFLLKKGKYDPMLLFDLGKAYAYNNEMDKAIEFFNRYKKEGKPKTTESVDREIECAQTAKDFMKVPIDVTFTNLGKEVNTDYFEGHPFVPEDESFIVFTTKRKGTTGNMQGEEGFLSDIYQTELKNNDKWTKAKSMGTMINTASVEEITSLSPNGSYIVFTMIDELNIQRLRYCEKVGKARAFSKAIDFGDLVNDATCTQAAGTISNDGTMIIFASDRKGGYGGLDLYLSVKLPNGTWGEPQNLGGNINTKYDESFPNFGVDNTTLYFASTGHLNMGGYDVFKSTFSTETHLWNAPKNLGYPVNSTDNDMNISFGANGRNGYISRTRKDGFGNSDIYAITFKTVEPQYTAVGLHLVAYDTYAKQIKDADSLIELHTAMIKELELNKSAKDSSNSMIAKQKAIKQSLDPLVGSTIVVTDASNNKVYGEYLPNIKTGRALLILPAGTYEVSVSNPNYKVVKSKLTVLDKSNFVNENQVNIVLHKGELDVAPTTKPATK